MPKDYRDGQMDLDTTDSAAPAGDVVSSDTEGYYLDETAPITSYLDETAPITSYLDETAEMEPVAPAGRGVMDAAEPATDYLDVTESLGDLPGKIRENADRALIGREAEAGLGLEAMMEEAEKEFAATLREAMTPGSKERSRKKKAAARAAAAEEMSETVGAADRPRRRSKRPQPEAPEEDMSSSYEDEEDDRYEDEDHADEDAEDKGLRLFGRRFSGMDWVVLITGIAAAAAILFLAVRTTGFLRRQREEVYTQAVGISMETEDALRLTQVRAITEAALSAQAMAAEAEEPQVVIGAGVVPDDEMKAATAVEIKATSVLQDLKIKFVNRDTATLVTGVPFRVRLTDPQGEVTELTNTDKDGVIYRKNLKGGTYRITFIPFDERDEFARDYRFTQEELRVEVKEQIAYEKIDVVDEIKKESEINVAQEDTAKKDTVVESVNTDTVEWVESTRTEVAPEDAAAVSAAEDAYEEVPKSDILDPAKKAYLYGAQRLARGASLDITSLGLRADNATGEGSGNTSTDPAPTENGNESGTGEGTGGGGNSTGGGGNSTGGGEGGGGTGGETPPDPPVDPPAPVMATVSSVDIGGVQNGQPQVTLTASGVKTEGEGEISYRWEVSGDGVNASGTEGASITLTFVKKTTATVKLIGSIGESRAEKSVQISGEPKPVPAKLTALNIQGAAEPVVDEITLTAKAEKTEGTGEVSYRWEVSGDGVTATATEGGSTTVKFSKEATAQIKLTATLGDSRMEKSISLKGAPKKAEVKLTGISFDVASLKGEKDTTAKFAVTLNYSDGSQKKTFENVKLTVENTKVAKLEENGTLRFLEPGTTNLIAQSGNVKAQIPVETAKISYKLKLEAPKTELAELERIVLKPVLTPAVKGAEFKFSTKDEGVVRLDQQGNCKGIIPGKKAVVVCTTVIDGQELRAEVTITVLATKELRVTPGNMVLSVGEKQSITAKMSGVESPKYKWTSSNTAVATVSGTGEVTGVAAGEATITVTLEGDDKYVCKVKVNVVNGRAPLKDKDGNVLYIKDKDGKYVPATTADYYTAEKFYRLVKRTRTYKYTGWQTIEGRTYFFDKDGKKVTGDQVIQGAKYSFNPDGSLVTGDAVLGIDVSTWNGHIDWNAVKNSGVNYAIIRCGYRGSTQGMLVEDSRFRTNIREAQAAGIKVGVYFFSQAVDEVEAVEEASMVLSLVAGHQISYPIYLDMEDSGGRADGLSVSQRTAVAQAFCRTIQNSGYKAGIYANKYWWTNKLDARSLTGYSIWLAQYAAQPTYTTTRYDLWQYSSTGRISGIPEAVDLNLSYMGY